MISLKFKQYDDTFHNYEQVKWCGSRRKAGGGSLSKILHGPSMFAVKAKIYGVLYNQASSIAFDETSSYWSALKSP